MTNEETAGETPRWLVEPPAPGELRIHIATGEGAELTPAVRAALEQLTDALYSQDVQGYAAGAAVPQCPDLRNCGTYMCDPFENCRPLISYPCLADVTCKVTKVTLGP